MYKWIAVTAIYCAVVIAIHYIHMHYFAVDVVFYSALLDCALGIPISLVCLRASRGNPRFDAFETTLVVVIWGLLGYALAISIPTVIDRSLSFYMLEKIQQSGKGIALNDFELVFTQGYNSEHHLVDIRLTEQLQSGTIRIDNNCVTLTPKGQKLASFSRWYRLNMLPRKRLLGDRYTDVLVDPFASGYDVSRYTCPKP